MPKQRKKTAPLGDEARDRLKVHIRRRLDDGSDPTYTDLRRELAEKGIQVTANTVGYHARRIRKELEAAAANGRPDDASNPVEKSERAPPPAEAEAPQPDPAFQAPPELQDVPEGRRTWEHGGPDGHVRAVEVEGGRIHLYADIEITPRRFAAIAVAVFEGAADG